jgi:hypothetical protein
MFNTLKYTQELEHAGFSREQAEVSVKILRDVMNENFATRTDLKLEVDRLENKIDSLGHKLDSRIDSLESRFQSSLRELEYKITIKLGTMITLAIGVTATIVKLIQH